MSNYNKEPFDDIEDEDTGHFDAFDDIDNSNFGKKFSAGFIKALKAIGKGLKLAGLFILAVVMFVAEKIGGLLKKLYKKIIKKYKPFSSEESDDDAQVVKKKSRTGSSVSRKKKGKGLLSGMSEVEFTRVLVVCGISCVVLIGAVIIIFALSKPDPVPVISTTSDAEVATEPSAASATITFGGSVVMKESLLSSVTNSSGEYEIYEGIKKLNNSFNSDLNIVSVLGAVNETSKEVSAYPTANYPLALVRAMKAVRINGVALASDHSFDMGYSGVTSTLDAFNNESITPFGLYTDMPSHDTPQIVEVNGIKIGFVNYSGVQDDNFINLTTDEQEFATKHYDAAKPEQAAAQILQEVQALKAEGAHYIVAMLRWGSTQSTEPSSEMRSLADSLVRGGVDTILGYGSSYTQKVTYKDFEQTADGTDKTCLVMYSLGNIYADNSEMPKDGGNPTDSLMINLEITLEPDAVDAKVTDITYTPLHISKAGDDQDISVRAKFMTLPSAQYSSSERRPEEFSTNSQWDACKNSFNRLQDKMTSWVENRIKLAQPQESETTASEDSTAADTPNNV